MVQVLVDFRHLARVRLLDLKRSADGLRVNSTFEVSSRVAPRSRLYDASVPALPSSSRREVLTMLWNEVLNQSVENIRAFVLESTKLPAMNEDLNLFPLAGDDDVDKIDASLVSGVIDGEMIRYGSITSDQIESLDAMKLVGTIDPERLRQTRITFDMLGGHLHGSRILPGTVTSHHISEVDASKVAGVLFNASLPPQSVTDEHIREVSWDKVTGSIPPERISLDFSNVKGRVDVDQLPLRIPIERIDLTGGLDLSLFTHGTLPVSCLADGSVHSRHIDSVDAAKLTGFLDGSRIAEGTVTGEALADVPGHKVTGDLDVDRIWADVIRSEHLSSGLVDVAQEIVASSVRVHGVVDASTVEAARSLRSDSITADTVDAGHVASGRLQCSSVSTERLDAKVSHVEHATAEDVQAIRVTCDTVDADRIDSDVLETSEATCGQLYADSVTSRSLESEAITTGDVHVENMHADSLSVRGDVSSDSMHVSHNLDVGDKLTATDVCAHQVITDEAVLYGSLTCQQATVHDLQVVDSLSTRDISADDISASGTVRAETVRANTLHTSEVVSMSDASFEVVHAFEASVETNLEVRGTVDCRSLQTDKLVCEDSYSTSTTAQFVRATEISAEAVDVTELETQTLSSKAIVTENMATHDLVVQNRLSCAALHSDLVESEEVHVSASARASLVDCQDFECSGVVHGRKLVVDEHVFADSLHVQEDIEIAGVSVSHTLADMEDRVRSALQTSRAGKPLEFDRREYFADTQFDNGHDVIAATSPAYPDVTISYAFTQPSSQGLTLDSLGQVRGTGERPGVFSIPTKASLTFAGDTYSLEINAIFRIFGPPVWTGPGELSVVQRTPFRISLSAEDATHFSATDPRLQGVDVSSGGDLFGELGVPGVYDVGAIAHRALEHNDHVLEEAKTFRTTVKPLRPVIWSQSVSPAFGTAGDPVTLTNVLDPGDDKRTTLTISEREPIPEPVVWESEEGLFAALGDVDLPLIARGAVTYSVAARMTFPVELGLSSDGFIHGTVADPTSFEICVRAHGSGGHTRRWDRGGHVDKRFAIEVRPPGVDFTNIYPLPKFYAGQGPVSFQVFNSGPRSYRLVYTDMSAIL